MNAFDLTYAAWWLHRTRPGHRQLVDLPATDMAHLLGRKCRAGTRHYQYTAHGEDGANTDRVTCGLTVIWRTGGLHVCRLLLEMVSEDDLAHHDYLQEVIWRSHLRHQASHGFHIPREHAPTIWRHGKQLSPDDHQMLIDRLDALHHHLDYLPGTLRRWRQ